jgi:hypothetical protein
MSIDVKKGISEIIVSLMILVMMQSINSLHAQAEYFAIVNVQWGSEASPGDLNDPLLIYIQYYGTTNLVSLVGTLYLPNGFRGVNGDSNITSYSGYTQAGSIIPLTFYISIDPSTPIGTYNASLQVTGRTIYNAIITQEFNVSIDLRGRADLVLDAFPRSLVPGISNNITMRIYNRGTGPAYNISLSYSVQGSGAVLSPPPALIPVIGPGSYVDIGIQLYVPPTASLQTLSLIITATYLNPYYFQRSVSQTLGLYVGQQAQTMISIAPLKQTLVAGSNNDVVLRITNLGSSKIMNLVITLSVPQQVGIISGDGKIYVGDLAPLESKEISFRIYVSPQPPQIIYIQVQESYVDNTGVPRTDITIIGFSVEYQPGYFQVLGVFWGGPQQPIQVGPGDSGVPLTIALRYIGNSTIYNANFTLIPPNDVEVLPSIQSASQYVASILPNSVLQLIYQVGISSTARIGYHFGKLIVSWDTPSRSGYSQALDVMLDIRGRADISISPLTKSLDPGSLNVLRLLVLNNGTGVARQITVSSIQASSASVIDYQPRQFDLQPGEGRVLNISIYIPPTMQQSPITLSISLIYIDPYGFSRSYSQLIGVYTGAQRLASFAIEPLTISLAPGYLNNITIKITNIGNSDIYNLSVSLSAQAQGAASLTPPRIVDFLGVGRSVNLSYQIYVPITLSGSTLVVLVTLSYVDQYGSQKSLTQQLGFYVSEALLSMINISISTTMINPGINNLTLYVINNGNSPISNVTLYIVPAPPIALVNSDGKYYIDRLDRGASWSTNIAVFISRVAAMPQQVYSTANLKISLTYYDAAGTLRTETRDIYLIIYIPPIVSPISVNIEPQVLVTGKINDATIYVKNVGHKDIENLQVAVSTIGGQISLIGGSSAQISRLSPGASLEIPTQIYVPPAASPSATILVDINYYIEGTLFHETRAVGMVSRGIIDIKVTDFTTIPERPSPGQIFSVTVTLTNMGTITASAVTATPVQTQNIRVFGSRSIFIGDMQVNSPTAFTVTLITSNNTSPGRYEIPIQLTYYDNLRTLYTVNISIPVLIGGGQQATVTRASQQGQDGVAEVMGVQWIYYIVIAIISLVVGIYIGRRVR